MELELEAQERSVGPFRADLLCKDTDGGSWVLIENQLERTDHRHLGQLLTYAAGLHAVTICWIAESFAEEHRATLDWLNEITDEKFRFFGLEVELWRIRDSPPAPKFNVVSKPNDWSRSVIDVKELTPKKRLQEKFWAALMKRLEERRSPVRPKKPQPQGWMQFSVGRSEFLLETTLQSTKRWICVDLFMTGPDSTAHFRLLDQQRDEIERELGKLEWRALPDRKSSSIRLRRKNVDPMQQEDWPNQIEWMVSTLEGFDKTFPLRSLSTHPIGTPTTTGRTSQFEIPLPRPDLLIDGPVASYTIAVARLAGHVRHRGGLVMAFSLTVLRRKDPVQCIRDGRVAPRRRTRCAAWAAPMGQTRGDRS